MKKAFLSLTMGLILLSGIILIPTQPTPPTNMATLNDHGWGG
ncbi:hypothetical protein [Paenibacillus sp. MZ04-78.2]|nr:hypothetical protein [Paenibacillus sp. MZ04-78.2]